MVNSSHVHFTEDKILLIDIQPQSRILVSVDQLLLVVNHTCHGSYNWKVLYQTHWVVLLTLLVAVNRWCHQNTTNDQSVMVNNIRNFYLCIGIFEIPVQLTHLLYSLRLEKS